MSREPIQRTIGDTTYEITQFSPSEGLEISLELTKVLGPAMAALGLFLAMGPMAMDTVVSPETARSAAASVTSELRPVEHAKLIKRLMKVVTVVGVGQAVQVFESHFVGRYLELYQLIGHVIAHNGFFGHTASLSGDDLKALISRYLPTSPGPSGDASSDGSPPSPKSSESGPSST